MAEKKEELSCLTEALNCERIKGKHSKELRQLLLEYIDYSVGKCESPDFIFTRDEGVVGIEHLRVDELFRIKNKKAQSMIGKQKSQIDKLVDKYKDEELLDEDIDNGNAMDASLKLVKEQIDSQNAFNYKKFIDNFECVTKEHNDKCSNYRNELSKYAKTEIKLLGCLIQIPFIAINSYVVSKGRKEYVQAVHGIPITKDMLLKIQEMKNFDFVILFMHTLDNNDKKSVCYYFLPHKIYDEVHEGHVAPFAYFKLPRFSNLPEDYEVEFPKELISHEQGNMTYTARVSKKN